MDTERFHHTRSAYERPSLPYRCGRAALWGKPCGRGPGVDGSCGGTAECTPFLKDGRWSCRRPASMGGSCAEGPLPDGSCAHRQLPCRPRPTLRKLRGRIAFFAALLPLILIAATFTLDGDSDSVLNPLTHGPLSGAHARFTDQQGCPSCHRAHEAGPAAWLAAAFTPADMTGQCIACHTFGGPERAPHNFPPGLVTDVTAHGGPAETSCIMCHQEHRGINARITGVSDSQCQTCHAAKFSAFGKDHPSFKPSYPYETRTAISFDHVSHFAQHFPQSPQAPKDGCIACHQVDKATNVVPVGGFETTCAACHGDQIGKKDLVVFALPELSPAQFVAIDHKATAEACGALDPDTASALADGLKTAQAAVKANDPQGDFVPISDQKLGPLQQLLLGAEGSEIVDLDPKDPGSQQLLDALPKLAKDGTASLGELIDAKFGEGRSNKLLAGLSPELVRRAACAWTANTEYAGKPPPGGGWYVDGVTLKYKPTGHADIIVRAWLEASLAPEPAQPDPGDTSRLADLRHAFLDRTDGLGSCHSCHALRDCKAAGSDSETIDKAAALRIEWHHRLDTGSRYVRFAHRRHISLLGPGTDCQKCHVPNNEADYIGAFTQVNPNAFASNFRGIRQEQCTDCHGSGQVRDDCSTCHNYHREPGFKKLMIEQQQARSDQGTTDQATQEQAKQE